MKTALTLTTIVATLACALTGTLAQDDAAPSERARGFKFDDFMIGAWWGPGPRAAEVEAYAECGFNVVMSGRYMQLDDYGHLDSAVTELDLAHQYGLGVMFDTYTMNENPWGGIKGDYDSHPLHHSATLPELIWLHEQLGDHPALIGYLLGDDYGALTDQLIATNNWMRENTPHLWPWICQNAFNPVSLAAHGNPVANPQIYPTLYQWGLPAEDLGQQYCATFYGFSRQCQEHDVIFWPMINAANFDTLQCPSDSLMRLPAYASIAYGAEGLWYFTYNNGALQNLGEWQTKEQVRRAQTPLYDVVKKVNHRLLNWGPRVLGRRSTGLFGTAFGAKNAAPLDAAPGPSAEGLTAPTAGKLIEAMDDDLIVGILTKEDERPLAMVVDCRTTKNFGDLAPRDVTIEFTARAVRVRSFELGETHVAPGNTITLSLDAGEGQLLELVGRDLGELCTTESIYAPAEP